MQVGQFGTAFPMHHSDILVVLGHPQGSDRRWEHHSDILNGRVRAFAGVNPERVGEKVVDEDFVIGYEVALTIRNCLLTVSTNKHVSFCIYQRQV